MDFVKRHLFLLGLVAVVLVVSLAVVLLVQFGYRAKNQAFQRDLGQAERELKLMLSPGAPVYSKGLVEELADRVEMLRERHRNILDEIARMGAEREPLVEGLLPDSVRIEWRHQFKAEYRDGIQDLMARLNAVDPKVPPEATDEAIEEKIEQVRKATLFADENSFIIRDWVNRPEAPPVEVCRLAQEDFWLMQDLVRIVAKFNADKLQRAEAVIRNAPVKELVEVRIGDQAAVLGNTTMRAGSTRYRRTDPRLGEKAASLTGRISRPGYYLVLPWRMDVVARSNVAGELVGRLKGTESFLTVTAWKLLPITESSFATQTDLLASYVEEKRRIYGPEGVVRLSIVGESLLFQLKDGRVTTPQDVAGTGVRVPGAEQGTGEGEGST